MPPVPALSSVKIYTGTIEGGLPASAPLVVLPATTPLLTTTAVSPVASAALTAAPILGGLTMKQIVLGALVSLGVTAASAQMFTSNGGFSVQTQNSPAAGGSNSVTFTPGLAQSLDGGALELKISVVNAPDFGTTGAQWAVFSYATPSGDPLSTAGQNWSINQVGVPFAQNVNFIADFTQWTVDGAPITQVSHIFNQPLIANPVPGGTGNGEGTSGFVDPIAAGPAPTLGAFANPFSLVINGLGGDTPTGFVQALEFAPQSFEPPSGVPEPSTWALGLIGFGVLAVIGWLKKRSAFYCIV